MKAAEVGTRWGMAARTIQQACTGYKGGAPWFTKEAARKPGRIWLVTRQGMEPCMALRKMIYDF